MCKYIGSMQLDEVCKIYFCYLMYNVHVTNVLEKTEFDSSL